MESFKNRLKTDAEALKAEAFGNLATSVGFGRYSNIRGGV